MLLRSASTVHVLELSGTRSSRLRSTLVDVAAKAPSTAALAENTSLMQGERQRGREGRKKGRRKGRRERVSEGGKEAGKKEEKKERTEEKREKTTEREGGRRKGGRDGSNHSPAAQLTRSVRCSLSTTGRAH